MKKSYLIRPFALALSVAMLMTAVGCNKGGDASSSGSTSSGKVPSGTSQGADVGGTGEGDPIERIFQIEKIDTGKARNADTVAWIHLPNTKIDNAVLQRKEAGKTHDENNSYYIHLDEDKKYDVFGCYWLDPDSKVGDRDVLSKNTIVYGHADYKDTGDGKRFSQLFKYTNLDYLRENPYIYFSTGEEDMVWQIFSVFYTNWKDFNYIQANPSANEFNKIISEAKSRNQYIIDLPVKDGDKILTLSTCTGLYNTKSRDDYRYVVMAKLLPSDEAPPANVRMEKNPNPKKS